MTAITKVYLPYIDNHGSILEVSSISVFVANTDLIVYCATKSYVLSLCLGLREELKERHINVCAMRPGFVITEMIKSKIKKGQSYLPIIDSKSEH